MTVASSNGGSPVAATPAPTSPSAPTSTQSASTDAPPAVPSFKGTKHRVKIGGEEKEVDYDDLVTDYQTRQAADVKFREAARLMKEAGATKAEIEAFKKNPIAALKEAGANPAQIRQFAEEYLLEHLEYEQLDPAERKAREAEARAKKAEEEASKYKKAEEERTRAAREYQAAKEIDEEIGSALKAMGRKPTPRLIARVAESLIADFEAKMARASTQYGDELPDDILDRLERMPASEAVKRVQQEYAQDIAEYLSSLPVSEIRKVLPKEILDGLRKADIDDVLSQDPVGSRKPRNQEAAPAKREKVKRMSSDSFFKKLDQKWGT